MNTDVKPADAVGRLRRYYAGEMVYHGPDGDANFTGDVLALMPPPDADELVAADWLMDRGGQRLTNHPHHIGLPCDGAYLWFAFDAAGGMDPRIEWDGGFLPGLYATRGAVLRLLAAFGERA